MKKIIYIFILLLFSACTNIMDEAIMKNSQRKTKSITYETSPYFNWEDTINISLFNIQGSIILPWYSSATTNIPYSILNDFKSADGWQMVYNTCSPSNIVQTDKYYLIFYNIFTGKLRCFAYMPHDITQGNTTFWQLTFTKETKLLNDLSKVTLTNDTISADKEIVTSNISNTPTKSLTRGWNSFEYDFLIYDPDIKNNNIAMSISAYDVRNDLLKASGNINLNSDGTIITTTTINSLSSPGFVKKGISMIGDYAKSKFLDLVPSKKLTKILSEGVKGIIETGANFLVDKFLGKKTSQVYQSISDIKIQTDGEVIIEAEIIGEQQSNISPISQIMVPGSIPTPQDIFLPSYNKSLGVWTLENRPIVKYSQYLHYILLEEYNFNRCAICTESIYQLYLDRNSINVTINPDIKDHIDKYTIDAQLVAISDYELDKEVPFYNHLISTGLKNNYQEKIKLKDNNSYLYILHDNFTFSNINGRIVIPYNKNDTHFQYPGAPLNLPNPPYIKHIQNNLYVKITTTIYPKPPYNTTPIVSTRTFKTNIINEKEKQ